MKPRKKSARFKVGQVVVWKGHGDIARIVRAGVIENEKYPVYWLGSGGYVPENYLRPLTALEAGRGRWWKRREVKP